LLLRDVFALAPAAAQPIGTGAFQNIKRDPFEQEVTFEGKSAMNFGRTIGAPSDVSAIELL
jgi:hypothetical protein